MDAPLALTLRALWAFVYANIFKFISQACRIHDLEVTLEMSKLIIYLFHREDVPMPLTLAFSPFLLFNQS